MNARTLGAVAALILGSLGTPVAAQAQRQDCNGCEQIIQGGAYFHRVIAAPMVLIGVTGNIHGWVSSLCSGHGHDEVPCNGFAVLINPDEAPVLALAELIRDHDEVVLDTRSGWIEFPACDGEGILKSHISFETQHELVAFLRMLSTLSD